MLKITILETPGEQRLILEGKLTEASVSELWSVWDQARNGRNNCKYVLDLCGVTAIDSSGKAMLVAMISEGARLTARGVYTKYLIQQLRREASDAGDSQRKRHGAGKKDLISRNTSSEACECSQRKEKE
jgi:ABC-type transporter Mla MlaB component